eukprot:9470503-Pyramimonas_sp.AAC.1
MATTMMMTTVTVAMVMVTARRVMGAPAPRHMHCPSDLAVGARRRGSPACVATDRAPRRDFHRLAA